MFLSFVLSTTDISLEKRTVILCSVVALTQTKHLNQCPTAHCSTCGDS